MALLKGAMTGKKKLLIGGGVVGAVVATLITAFIAFLPLKIEHMMKNIYDHHFKRTTVSYEKRRSLALSKYFRDRFTGSGAIIDNSGPLWKEALGNLHKNGFEKKLIAQGYKFEYGQVGNPNSRILKITTPDKEEITQFNTLFEKKAAREEITRIAEEAMHGEGYLKRLRAKHFLQVETHTKWHWLDPIKQPFNKVKYKVYNEFVSFLLENDITSGLMQQTFSYFLGNDLAPKFAEKLATEAASEEVIATITPEAFVEVASEVASGVGLVVLACQVSCGITKAAEDHAIQKIARQKVEMENMIAFTQWQSKADQLKTGNTDANVVRANMEMLTSEDGQHDIGESNNYLRATGEDVPYKPSDDCDSGKEMCLSAQPKHILDGNILANLFGKYGDLLNNPVYKFIASFMPGAPGSYSMDLLCKYVVGSITKVLSVGGKAFDFLLSHTPLVSSVWNKFKSWTSEILGAVFKFVLAKIVPPTIDGTTRGPQLVNHVAAGADLSANAYDRSWCGSEDDDTKCKLTPEQAKQVADVYDQEQLENFKRQPFWTRVASLDNPNSIAYKLYDRLPASPQVAVNKFGRNMVAMLNPDNLLQMFGHNMLSMVPAAYADTPGPDPFDIDQYGFTLDQLNKPLGDPELDKLDTDVACSMVADYGGKDDKDYPPQCNEATGNANE